MLFSRKKKILFKDVEPASRLIFRDRKGALRVLEKPEGTGARGYIAQLGDDQVPMRQEATGLSALFNNQNYISNSLFLQKDMHWVADGKPVRKMGRNFNEEWTLKAAGTGFASIPSGNKRYSFHYQDPAFGSYLPVIAGQSYQFQGHFGLHRLFGNLIVDVYDARLKKIKSVQGRMASEMVGGADLSLYGKAAVKIEMPAKAAFAMLRFEVAVDQKNKQEMDCFLFFTCLYFGFESATISPWIGKEQYFSDLIAITGKSDYVSWVADLSKLSAAASEKTKIDVLYSDTGKAVDTVPELYVLPESQTITGDIDSITYETIQGHIKGEIDSAFYVNIFAGNELVATSQVEYSGGGEQRHFFACAVPAVLCRDEVLVVQIKSPRGRLLCQEYRLFPSNLMPWEAIQEHSMPPFPNHLAPLAGRRYQALQSQLHKLTDAEALRQVIYCHDRVVEGFEVSRQFKPLSFPKVDDPDVSIIIPVHNKFEVTYFCLCSLLLASNDCSFEVIITDDGSSDRTIEIPTLINNVKYVRNEKALGFVGNCNGGAEVAAGRYLYFLNNDTEATDGFLDALLYGFANFEDVGLAGSKFIYPDGRLQEAGGLVWGSGDPWNYGRLDNCLDPRFCYTRQVDYVSGAGLMITKGLWHDVGGFSEDYAPAYFEDADLAYKVREKGLRSIFVPQSVIVHHEGISNSTDVTTTSGLKRFQEINRPKFQQRWQDKFIESGAPSPDNADLAKDRGIRGRVLCIDMQMPRTDQDAGSYAAIQEIKTLQSLGFKVTMMPDNAAYLGKYTHQLERMGVETIYAPFYSWVGELLEKRGREFDIVYITRYHMMHKYVDLVRTYAPQAKLLFCNADLHFLREQRKAQLTNDQEALKEIEEVKSEELQASLWADVTLSYNEIEHEIIRKETGGEAKVAKCPWIVSIERDIPAFEAREGIAFLGGYRHPPNLEAMLYFVAEVMPELVKAKPDLQLYIYGSAVPEELKALAGPNVQVVGFVADVAEVYTKHRLFVVPLLSGAGIKGKVIGAMAYGIPSIMSPIAVEGTGAKGGKHCLVAESNEDWVAQVVDLYEDQAKWNAMSAASLDFVEANYSFEKGVDTMYAALSTVMPELSRDHKGMVIGIDLP